MRAYQLPQATGIDALVKVDLPTPKPGPRQVLIKVAACSLNYRDLAIVLGTYRMPTKPNLVPLSDRGHPFQLTGRCHRWNAQRIRRARRGRLGQAADSPVVRGRRYIAVRGGDGVARPRRARPHRRGPDRSRPGNWRRLDLRPA